MKTTLAFSCLHAPYVHPHALEFLSELRRKYKPSTVVCLGDEIDSHAVSRFVHNPDLPSAGEETARAVKYLRPLYKLFPQVHVCVSNHTWRGYLRARDAGVPEAYLRPIQDVLQAPPGWQWKNEWYFDGVIYRHGEGFGTRQPALVAAEKLRSNVVIGHVHTAAGVVYSYGPRDKLFGMSVGCLIDDVHPAFEYSANNPLRPAIGAGIIFDGVPVYVPMYI